MPVGVSNRVVFEEFGKRPKDLFLKWSEKPFVAASIGQVHRAQLFTGEEVAVKVQYPKIVAEIESDLDQLLKGTNPEIAKDFRERILEECDFLKEAENQTRFKSIFEDARTILIPKVFGQLTSQSVLTTEFVEGKSYRDFLDGATQVEKNRAAETIIHFFTFAGFKHGLIQGDPHPGNYLFCKEGWGRTRSGTIINSLLMRKY